MAILGIDNAGGFRSGTKQIMKKGLFDKLKLINPYLASKATETVKAQFGKYSKVPILSGYTQKSTKAISTLGDKALVIRFKTPNDKESGDGKQRGYAYFPLMGLSTSRKYGKRNWLLDGAKEMGSLLRKDFK